MKALTILQPYAELIARGLKRVENRTWYTAYRGPLLIHAGKSHELLATYEAGSGIPIDDLEFGAFVATSTLVDCLRIEHIETGEYDDKYPWLRAHEHTH